MSGIYRYISFVKKSNKTFTLRFQSVGIIATEPESVFAVPGKPDVNRVKSGKFIDIEVVVADVFKSDQPAPFGNF